MRASRDSPTSWSGTKSCATSWSARLCSPAGCRSLALLLPHRAEITRDMAEELRVAAVQMSSQDDLAHNLGRAVALIERAAAAGAGLVILPENFAYMGTDQGKRGVAEVLDARTPGPIL